MEFSKGQKVTRQLIDLLEEKNAKHGEHAAAGVNGMLISIVGGWADEHPLVMKKLKEEIQFQSE